MNENPMENPIIIGGFAIMLLALYGMMVESMYRTFGVRMAVFTATLPVTYPISAVVIGKAILYVINAVEESDES